MEEEEDSSPLAVEEEEVEEDSSPLAVEEVSSLSSEERENKDLEEESNLLAVAMPMMMCHPHHPRMAAHPA